MKKADWFCCVLLCLLSVALWAPRLQGPLDLRYDAGVYYVTGTALAEGKGYRLLNEPGQVPAVQYPPALPAFVAAHQLILGTSDPQVVGQWMRWSYFGLFTAYLLAAYALSRRYLRPASGFAAVAISALFVQTYFLSDLLFTELPFTLVSLLFILCNRRSEKGSWLAVCGLLGAVAYLLRSAGIALLGAWVLEALVRRRWKQLAVRVAVVLVPVVSWQAYLASTTSGAEYTQPAYEYQRAPYQYYNVPYVQNIMLVDPFKPEDGEISMAGLVGRVAGNMLQMPPRLGEVVSTSVDYWDWALADLHRRSPLPRVPTQLAYVPLTLLGLLIIGGAVWLARRGEWFIPLYLFCTVGIVALTPWPAQFARYLTPAAPLLSLCMLIALVAIRRYVRANWSGRARGAGSLLIALILGGVLLAQLFTLQRSFAARSRSELESFTTGEPGTHRFFYDATWRAYADAIEWVRRDAQSGDVLGVSIPQWTYIKTGLTTVMLPMEADVNEHQRLLDGVPVRYVVIDQAAAVDIARRYTQPTVEAHPDLWELVLTLPHRGASGAGIVETRVYRRITDHKPVEDTSGLPRANG